MSFDAKDIEDNKLWASLAYVSVLSLVVLFTKKDSKYAQEHAKQGTVLFIVEVAWWVISAIPFLWIITIPLGFLWGLLVLCVSLYAMYNAWNGKLWEIPVIGQFRSKVNV